MPWGKTTNKLCVNCDFHAVDGYRFCSKHLHLERMAMERTKYLTLDPPEFAKRRNGSARESIAETKRGIRQ